MFRRRFFFDITSGEALRSYIIEGDLKRNYTAEQEAAQCALTNWGVLEWLAPDTAVEAAFADIDAVGNPRAVRASVADGELHFEYTPLAIADDPYEVIDILTGEAENEQDTH